MFKQESAALVSALIDSTFTARNYRFRGRYVPTRLIEGLENHVRYGIKTDSPLVKALLENDLKGAMLWAIDEDVLKGLPAAMSWLYQEAPHLSWGSPEKVSAWVKAGGIGGKR
jgi:hypothetical protein